LERKEGEGSSRRGGGGGCVSWQAALFSRFVMCRGVREIEKERGGGGKREDWLGSTEVSAILNHLTLQFLHLRNRKSRDGASGEGGKKGLTEGGRGGLTMT